MSFVALSDACRQHMANIMAGQSAESSPPVTKVQIDSWYREDLTETVTIGGKSRDISRPSSIFKALKKLREQDRLVGVEPGTRLKYDVELASGQHLAPLTGKVEQIVLVLPPQIGCNHVC
eukprot:COSAG06_NODE_15332_length_1079_cov_8.495918_2_plen_120_part_00